MSQRNESDYCVPPRVHADRDPYAVMPMGCAAYDPSGRSLTVWRHALNNRKDDVIDYDCMCT